MLIGMMIPGFAMKDKEDHPEGVIRGHAGNKHANCQMP
jgi:hypothetical protein